MLFDWLILNFFKHGDNSLTGGNRVFPIFQAMTILWFFFFTNLISEYFLSLISNIDCNEEEKVKEKTIWINFYQVRGDEILRLIFRHVFNLVKIHWKNKNPFARHKKISCVHNLNPSRVPDLSARVNNLFFFSFFFSFENCKSRVIFRLQMIRFKKELNCFLIKFLASFLFGKEVFFIIIVVLERESFWRCQRNFISLDHTRVKSLVASVTSS